jgi:signal transduction histidine kinase/CheY-like chemotaxis protein
MRRWIAVCIVVPALLFALAVWYDRAATLRNAHDRLASTVDALAAHAEAVLQTASLALALQLDSVKDMDWQTIATSADVHRVLVRLTQQLPQVDSAFFVDPEGRNSASSRAFPMPPYNVSDREYYRAAKDGESGLVVSAPFVGRAAGTLGFTVSRARLRNGAFDGVAAVTLSPAYFGAVYRSVVQWPEASDALLVRRDGTVLARFPAAATLPDRLPPDSPTMRALAAGGTAGFFSGASVADGRDKLGAFRALPGRDVFMVFGLDTERALAQWRIHLAICAGFALFAMLALTVTARLALRRADSEQANLQALVVETGRRQAAEATLQQMQKMEALGRLTGGVAHDFNNLLTVVLGSIELATLRVSDPRVLRLLSAAGQAAQRGAGLTAQMLAFARRQPLELRPIDVNEALRGMDQLLHRTAGALVQIDYELAEGLWPVLADPVQLELALLNLVANARDAMPQGGSVTIRTVNLAAGNMSPGEPPAGLAPADHVAIAVQDTGEGMSEEVRANAFEPFFTTKEPGKGTGLGLSMIYGFARQAGGTVTLDSAPGAGTTVRIILPRSEPATTVPSAEPPMPDEAAMLRILLVDDDAGVRALAREMLQETGHLVTDVASGTAALALLRTQEAYDVLLLDFAMPGMNGGQVATAAAAIRPELPIVFMTGYAEIALLKPWVERGFAMVDKPFRAESLQAAIQKAGALPLHPARG